ncbi:MAG: hypothetical protein ACYS99_07660 [Planctomycetota bacterium]|jgi:hypothetical protein
MLKRLAGDIDTLLRGQFTRREDLRGGRIDVPVRTLFVMGVLLGAIYGVFMGLYAALRGTGPGFLQLLTTMLKVPLLFLLTLVVTFPSLYVFSALANSRLRSVDTFRLLLVGVSVNLALLASLGPVTGFFTLSTTSYPFMIFLNVLFFGFSGFVGLVFLRKALDAVFEEPPPEPAKDEPPPAPPAEGEPPGTSGEGEKAQDEAQENPTGLPKEPPEPPPILVSARRVVPRRETPKRVFIAWMVMYGIVGAQMGWILRPFIGSPHLPFQVFRVRESSFFESFFQTLGRLLG